MQNSNYYLLVGSKEGYIIAPRGLDFSVLSE